MKLIFTLIFLSLVFHLSKAQNTFEKAYDLRYPLVLTNDSDGSSLLIGNYLTGPLNHDIGMVKIDFSGDTIWSRIVGGNFDEYGELGIQTSDNGYIVVGPKFYSPAPNYYTTDALVLKIDLNGDTIWTKTLTGPLRVISSLLLRDGNILLLGIQGAFPYNSFLLKLDQNVNTIWCKSFDCLPSSDGSAICESSDSNLIFTCTENSHIKILKFDQAGNLNSEIAYGNFNIGTIFLSKSITASFDDGLIISGMIDTTNSGSHYCFFLMKTDASGQCIWAKKYNSNENIQKMKLVKVLNNGEIIFSGLNGHFSGSSGDHQNGILVKNDSIGNMIWAKHYGDRDWADFKTFNVLPNGGFLLSGDEYHSNGTNWATGYIIKTDSLGQDGCSDTLQTLIQNDVSIIQVSTTTTTVSNLTLATHNTLNYTSKNINYFNLCSTTNFVEGNSNDYDPRFYPNPSNGIFYLKRVTEKESLISVYNSIGEQIFFHFGNLSELDLSNEPSGIYFYELQIQGEAIRSGKLIMK